MLSTTLGEGGGSTASAPDGWIASAAVIDTTDAEIVSVAGVVVGDVADSFVSSAVDVATVGDFNSSPPNIFSLIKNRNFNTISNY